MHHIFSPIPEYAYDSGAVRATFTVLSVLHIAVTTCVLASYFVINRPRFPRLFRASDSETDEDSPIRERFFSVKTFWYLVSVNGRKT